MVATLKTGVIQEPSSGTANLTLDASGGVTVGQNLTVAGTTTFTGGSTFTGNATAAAFIPSGSTVPTNGLYRPAVNTVGLATNSTNALYIDASQNVGIGTTSPSAKLQVVGGIRVVNTGNSSYYTDLSDGGGFVLNVAANNPFVVYTGGAEKMRIDSSGNVGIGTSSPANPIQTYKLGAYSASSNNIRNMAYFQADATVSNSSIIFDTNPSAGQNLRGFRIGYQSSDFSITRFHTDKTTGAINDLTIDSSGNVGIGTSSPDNLLHVNGQSTFGSARVSSNSWMSLVFDKNAYFGLVIRQTGSDTGGGQPITFNNVAGTNIGSITSSASNVSYNTSSDYRLKHEIAPITTGLANVSALKPVTYKWRADDSVGEGFIAHELQSVIPLAVTGEKDEVDDDGNIKPQGVDYSKIVVHLVAAIQELTAKVTALEAKVGA